MTTVTGTASKFVLPLSRPQIERRLQECPRLPSLSTINSALREILTNPPEGCDFMANEIRALPGPSAAINLATNLQVAIIPT